MRPPRGVPEGRCHAGVQLRGQAHAGLGHLEVVRVELGAKDLRGPV